ncbi:M1 family peptidase, partial [Clostridiaceae bacterium UIB06]|nr:M1 family peptidase [Clostridiaceae bacterium UIB06]
VNSYYLSKDEKSDSKTSGGEKVLDSAVGAVKFFSQQFGKYPYDNLNMVETYLSGGAMEYPQLVQMPKYADNRDDSNTSYDDMDGGFESSFILEAAVHEVGHQWWYVTVGDNEFKESFLDESITAFSTAYYFEKTCGEYSENGIVSSLRRMVSRKDESTSDGTITTPSINSSVDKFKNMGDYGRVIYGNGALLFEDLRKKVGEDKFLDIMQTYFKQYKFKNASISGFLDIVEQKAGKSVRDSINASLNSPNYNPQNLKLSDEEHQKLNNEQLKERIKNMEAKKGIVLGSIFLRLINGEKVIAAIPANLSKEQKDNLIMTMDGQLGSTSNNLVIKENKNLTEDDLKNNNIIFIGNPWDNKELSSIAQNFPVTLTKTGVYSNNFSVRGENISGNVIVKNPLNENKLLFISFDNKENFSLAKLDIYRAIQFSIYIDGKQNYSGNF